MYHIRSVLYTLLYDRVSSSFVHMAHLIWLGSGTRTRPADLPPRTHVALSIATQAETPVGGMNIIVGSNLGVSPPGSQIE